MMSARRGQYKKRGAAADKGKDAKTAKKEEIEAVVDLTIDSDESDTDNSDDEEVVVLPPEPKQEQKPSPAAVPDEEEEEGVRGGGGSGSSATAQRSSQPPAAAAAAAAVSSASSSASSSSASLANARRSKKRPRLSTTAAAALREAEAEEASEQEDEFGDDDETEDEEAIGQKPPRMPPPTPLLTPAPSEEEAALPEPEPEPRQGQGRAAAEQNTAAGDLRFVKQYLSDHKAQLNHALDKAKAYVVEGTEHEELSLTESTLACYFSAKKLLQGSLSAGKPLDGTVKKERDACIWLHSYFVKWLKYGNKEEREGGVKAQGGGESARDPMEVMKKVALANLFCELVRRVALMEHGRTGLDWDHCGGGAGGACGASNSALCDCCFLEVWGKSSSMYDKGCACLEGYWKAFGSEEQQQQQHQHGPRGGKGRPGSSEGRSSGLAPPFRATEEDTFFCPSCVHALELIQAVRDNDLERVIHMVWLRRANPYFAPFFLPPPIEAESKVGFVLTARAAAARSQRAQALGPPRRSLVEAPMSALHWAAKTANYEGAQVLLSGASAIPPLFFRLVYSPLFSPSPNPASLVPPGPLSHLKVYLHWKLFGADPPTAGGEVEGPPPHDDFTRGAELARIPWENDVDDELPPTGFIYIRRPVPGREVEFSWLKPGRACHCRGSNGCNGGGVLGCNEERRVAIDSGDCSFLFHACSHRCRCAFPPSLYPAISRLPDRYGKPAAPLCQNAFEELGPQYKLVLFKTRGYGWGMRADEDIPKNGVVAIYASKVETSSTAAASDYSFELPRASLKGLHLDGERYGGCARFLNHCCMPGDTLKRFAYEPAHGDAGEPRIVFLAKRDVKKGEELTFAYHQKAFQDEEGGCHCKTCRKE